MTLSVKAGDLGLKNPLQKSISITRKPIIIGKSEVWLESIFLHPLNKGTDGPVDY